MANPFADEIKWWQQRAANYDAKRAKLRPISFDYISKGYSEKGNLNAASNFNTARSRLMQEDATLRKNLIYTPPVAAGTTPTHPSALKPSTDVMKLDAQVQKEENKIKALGADAFRTTVGGLSRVADVVSRFGYAIRSSALEYAKDNASDGKITGLEKVETFARPVFDLITMAPRIAENALSGESDETYHAMWEGFSGRRKTEGKQILQTIMPEFTSDHKKWTSVLGFVTDVVYDPLSWVTLGQGTVVTGAAKGATAGVAAATGRKAFSKALLDNTIMTKSGREAGRKALQQDVLARQLKPLSKQQAKVIKSVDKMTNRSTKALSKGKTELAEQYAKKAEHKAIARDKAIAEIDMRRAAVMQESYTGIRLAYKAIVNKSLGLNAYTAYAKGVNTGGVTNASAKAVKAMQLATKDEIKARFISTGPEASEWIVIHNDILASGENSITYANGKTFKVSEDYEQFINDFTDKIFPEARIAEITKKDRKARHGQLRAQDAEIKKFFQAFTDHHKGLKHNDAYRKSVAARQAKAAPKAGAPARVFSAGEKASESPVMVKTMPAKEAMETAFKREQELRQAAIAAAEASRAAALAKSADAEVLLGEAQRAKAAADMAYTDAQASRMLAEQEESAIQALVDQQVQMLADAHNANPSFIESGMALTQPATQLMDNLNGVSEFSAALRNNLSAKAQSVFDETKASLEASLSDIPNVNVVKGQVEVAGGVKHTFKKGDNNYTREVNRRIAETIQGAYDLLTEQLTVRNLADDAEATLDAMGSHVNYLLNRMYADTHIQTMNHLHARGYSLLPEAPALKTVMQAFPQMSGPRSMSSVLDAGFTYEKRGGTRTPYKNLDKFKEAVPKLFQHVFDETVVKFIGRAVEQSKHIATKDGKIVSRSHTYDFPQSMADFRILLRENGNTEALNYTTKVAMDLKRSVNFLDTARHITVRGEASPSELIDEFIQMASTLNHANHGTTNPSVGTYTFLDYWMFGTNTAKESKAAYNVADRGKKANTGIGRVGFLSPLDEAQGSELNSYLNTIPAMDGAFAETVGKVKGLLADVETNALFDHKKNVLNQIITSLLLPDLNKVMKEGTMSVDSSKLMESLGAHLYLLGDTTVPSELKDVITVPKRIEFAHEVWDMPHRMHQLNESVLIFNLYQVVANAKTPEIAAQMIAERIAKYPDVHKIMNAAKEAGVTEGTTGIRTPDLADPAIIERRAQAAADEADANFIDPQTVEEPSGVVEFKRVKATADEDSLANNPEIYDIIKSQESYTTGDVNNIAQISTKDTKVGYVSMPNEGEPLVYVLNKISDADDNQTLYLTKTDALKADPQGISKGNFETIEGTAVKVKINKDTFTDRDNDDIVLDVLKDMSERSVEARTAADSIRASNSEARVANRQRAYEAEKLRLTQEADAAKAAEVPVEPAPDAGLMDQLDTAKTATSNARNTEAAAAKSLADADTRAQEALAVSGSAADGVATANKAVADAEAIKVEANTVTSVGDANKFNAPGGHTAPSKLSADTLNQMEDFADELLSEINVAELDRTIEASHNAMLEAMAEYQSKVNESLNHFDIQTRHMLKFAGIPLIPLSTANTPMHSYAGLVGMKESQGRVANWLQSKTTFNERFRRPSSQHEGTLEDMRRSFSNNSQNRMVLNHRLIRETYKHFTSKMELKANVRSYFDKSMANVPEKLAPFADRMLSIQNLLYMRARGAADDLTKESLHMKRTEMLDDVANERLVKNLHKEAKDFNDTIPYPYQLPKSLFESDSFKALKLDGAEPFSREWLIAVGDWLDHAAPNHVLAAKNRGKFSMQQFDLAMQHSLTRMEMNTQLHKSMFDNFTFRFNDDMVEKLNDKRPSGQKYVKVNTQYNIGNSYTLFGDEVGERWVSEDILAEMSKISSFMTSQGTARHRDLNFEKLGKINNYWKAMVTTWNIPKYHISNVMSDAFLSAMDGTGVDAYRKAAIVMSRSHELRRKIELDPEGYAQMLRPDLTADVAGNDRLLATMIGEMGDPSKAHTISSINVGGKQLRLTTEDVYKMYLDYGLAQTQVTGNLLRSSNITKTSQFTDKVMDLSNGREDYFRIAHFIHALESESQIPGRTLHEIAKSARDRVVKFHFDYGDVSEVERIAVARYMPFYKWTRNIVPLAMNQMITNPKAYIINFQGNQLMGDLMFPTQEDDNGNPIPASYVTPEWVGEGNMVPIGAYTDPEGNEQARYAVLNLPLDQAVATWIMPFVGPMLDPGLTTVDALNQGVMSMASTAVGSTNPAFKTVVQAATGQSVVPGDHYDNDAAWYQGLASFVPMLPQWQAASKVSEKGIPQDATSLMDLTGVLRGTDQTEKNSKGELRRQQDRLKAQYTRAAADWMEKNHPDLSPNSPEAKQVLHDYFVQQGILQR